MIVDLGCGLEKYDGSIGVDHKHSLKADVIAEIDGCNLPFKSNSFEGIICSHILEHIREFENIMREIHRIGKPNAIVKIQVPYFSSVHAFTDPTHVRFFSDETFDYFTGAFADLGWYSWFSEVKNEISFWKIRRKYDLFKWIGLSYLCNRFRRFYRKFLPFILTAQCLKVELKVVK